MPDDSETPKSTTTFYFGYGSNMWIDQMNRRCTENKYIGIAVLHDWCWIINQRGYANIIPSSGDYVYGFIYELNPKNEASLDIYEGAPRIYDKKIHPVQLRTSPGDGEMATKKTINALVYIDTVSTSPDVPKTEYIHRINLALQDGIKNGVPQSYIDKYIRPFIPAESQ
ncbi:Butirosin biosynthesis, BtrG-like protein [Russula aff. rugulosa BPL654]|nr:Butirosin biosynthesis, BtrG-like protein [Russula aff. rugulosa BPL654]